MAERCAGGCENVLHSGNSLCRIHSAFRSRLAFRLPIAVGTWPQLKVTATSAAADSGEQRRMTARDVRINWGAHNGKPLGTLSDEYLHWLATTVKAEWGRLAQEVLDDRNTPFRSSTTPAATPSSAPTFPSPAQRTPSAPTFSSTLHSPAPTSPSAAPTAATFPETTTKSSFDFGFKRYAKENIDYVRSVDLEAGREYPECCDEPEFPSKDDFLQMIKKASDARDLKEGKRVHARVYNSEFRRNRMLTNLLIDMYERCGDLLEARRVFNSVNQPDIGCWNLMLRAYAKHGELQDAREIFDLMPERDAMSWELIIRAYREDGNTEEADRLSSESGLPDSDGVRLRREAAAPLLCFHTDRMSAALKLSSSSSSKNSSDGNSNSRSSSSTATSMWFVKNLAICDECHASLKAVSTAMNRPIIVRDATTFHVFKGGACSCERV